MPLRCQFALVIVIGGGTFLTHIGTPTDLTEILRTSRDYEEMKHVWQAWRDASGKKMRRLFSGYVRHSNNVAKFNGKQNSAIFFFLAISNDSKST